MHRMSNLDGLQQQKTTKLKSSHSDFLNMPMLNLHQLRDAINMDQNLWTFSSTLLNLSYKARVCKVSQLDVSKLQIPVNRILFSYPSQFKCTVF